MSPLIDLFIQEKKKKKNQQLFMLCFVQKYQIIGFQLLKFEDFMLLFVMFYCKQKTQLWSGQN